jgi:hypothetical protein
LQEFERSFKSAVDGVFSLLGKQAFRLLDNNANADKNFDSAIFDAQMVGFAHAARSSQDISSAVRKRFLAEYRSMQNDKEYLRAISASTSDPPLVRLRIRMFKELIERIIVN